MVRRTEPSWTTSTKLWGAVNASAELWKLGEQQKALKLLDGAIAYWIQEGKQSASIRTLCHHAAVLCRSAGDLSLVKHYYQQSLTHSPEDPIALYGLAEVALEQGDTDLAKQYAKRSYDATVQGDDEMAKDGLLDLIAMKWPDIASK
jgi:Tfp pilus assembly protein PilF